MSSAELETGHLVLVGRSSSHFTRVARIFAAELGVPCELSVVRDLTSADPAAYGGNPALKIPSLRTARGVWFGAANVCRELWRCSEGRPSTIVWPEQLELALLANAQELTLHAMSAEVALIMDKLSGGGARANPKPEQSLLHVLAWLERHVAEVLAALPASRSLSFLEVTLYCLVTHLEFRDIVPLAPYPELCRFRDGFGRSASAESTRYCFDS